MRSFIWIWTGILLAAIAIGCGPGKELPDTRPQPKPQYTPPPDPQGPVPATSDPKAKEVADRALKAITNNNPALVAKARICTVTAKGTLVNLELRELKCTRLVQTVWPDRARVSYIYSDLTLGKSTLGIINHSGWFENTNPGAVQPSTGPTEIATWAEADLFAQQWFILGLPFAENSAVFFDLQKEKTPLISANVIKVGLRDRPVYQIAFDDKSDLPVRIHYYPLEFDPHNRLNKLVKFAEHELDSSGFRLPKRLMMEQNSKESENWTVEKWEFPDKLDDALFSSPK
jgi:hypothetical protein